MDRATKPLANMHRQMLANVRRIQLALLAAGATLAALINRTIKGSEAQRSAMALLEARAGRMGPAFAVAAEAISGEFGSALGFSKTQVANLLLTLQELFGSAEAASKSAGPVMVLARVLGIDLAQAARLFADAADGDVEAVKRLMSALPKLKGEDFLNFMTLNTGVTREYRIEAENATPATAKLGAAWSNLVATLGGTETGPLNTFVETLSSLVLRVNEFLKQHPAFVEALGGLALAIGLVVGTLTLLMGWFLITMALAPAWGAAIALLTGPVGLVTLIVLGLILMGWRLHKEWQQIWADTETTTLQKALLIGESILRLFPVIDDLLTSIGWLKENWRTTWEFIANATKRWVDFMIGPIITLIGWVDQAISALARLGVAQSSGGGSSGGATRRFAEGGVMPSTGLAMVGERGPELVALPGGSRVFPNRTLAGAGGGLTIIFQGPVYGLADFDAKVNQAVSRTRRGGGFEGF